MKTPVASIPLADLLDRYTTTAAAELCHLEGDRLRCLACGHRCLIGDGLRGICKVRFNSGGELRVPTGYVAGLQSDPVEKKPFFHLFPGSDALTFGMMGCDLHCSYCQNWVTSQALRDTSAVAPVRPVTPTQLVDIAKREGSRLVVSSYNEPLITAEWAVDVFREAKRAGLTCAFVSNGNATPEVLDYLRPWISAYKVDLKAFQDRAYRSLGGTLDSITNTIRMIHERGLWLEIVTLVIPGFNDSDDELRRAADFLASVSPDIPWHVTAFHKDYRMTDPDATRPDQLVRAAEIGMRAGLRYIYAGNLPGQVGPWENTRCPSCHTTVIERYGYLIRGYHLTPDGRCPACQALIPGVWPGTPGDVRTGNDLAAYRNRLPRPLPLAGQVAVPNIPSRSPGGTMASPTVSRPELTPEQKQQILTATAAMLRDVVVGARPAFTAPALSELPVAGAFVSLKRGKHLRACCGVLGATITLQRALEQAADRTIWEDERVPPVSPTELHALTLEVWLLRDPEPVPARGAERARAITVGKHGIKVVRGNASGLFLPSVAVDNDWDAERFLDQVSLKANLPATAWRDDATALFRFEGEVVRGPVGGTAGELPTPPGPCRSAELALFTDLSRANIVALLTGAVPRYFWGAPDGQVNGLVLFVDLPGRGLRHFSRISLRPSMALQANLFTLVQAAAQQLRGQGINPAAVPNLPVGVMMLHDPTQHGTVADPQLDGVDPRRRALLVLERGRSALVFDPQRSPPDLLAEAARQANVGQGATAAIYSFEVTANVNRAVVANVPNPVRGPALRLPAVAGQFYDIDATALARTVDRLLEGPSRPEPWAAAMIPHAGLTYSGKLAADVLKRVKIPRTVIVIGPKHTPHGMDWAVAPHEKWAIPGGEIASDFMWARRLSQAIDGLALDAAAHQREHAIEVELPLLARLAPESRVIGIALGHADLNGCWRFAAGLARLLRESDERPLLLISSDMNHFATDAETRRLDELALDCLRRRDPVALFETVQRHNISMCGVLPAVIVLETLRLLETPARVEQVGYATSADVTGDTSRVVGYAGMLFA